jgi:hypothetical protein
MMRAIVTLVLALSLSGIAAARDFEMLEEAHEIVLAEVALPSSAAGAVVFRPCADCDTVRLQVSSRTRYLIGGREVALPDFLLAVDAVRQGTGGETDTVVAVFTDVSTQRVTRVAVFPPRA